MIKQEQSSYENFNFCSLVAQYRNHIALKVRGKNYTYKQLNDLIEVYKKTLPSQPSQIIFLNQSDVLQFVVKFLAIKAAGHYPFIAEENRLLPKKRILLPKDTLFLGSTSGTTGVSKIFYRNWYSWKKGFDSLTKLFDFKNCEVIVSTSPLSTSLGLHTFLLSLYMGKTFQLERTLVGVNQINQNLILFSVPTFLLRSLHGFKVSSYFKIIFLGGGVLFPRAVENLNQIFPKTLLVEFYGSSEASFISWQNIKNGKRAFDVGKPFPETEIMIGNQQEIIIESPYLFSGYIEESSHKTWITDDLGKLENQHLFLIGRRDDMIDHGGNKISPYEIESAAKDVCEACVAFGVVDPVYGQKIALLLIHPLSRSKIDVAMLSKLPQFKRPQIYLSASHIPLTGNQKVSRKLLENFYRKGEFNVL